MSVLPRSVQKMLKPALAPALLAWERMESGVSYDPTARRMQNYPYDTYTRMRSKDPVHRMRLIDGWALTRYDDVDMALRDHKRFYKNNGIDDPYRDMLRHDPPDHTRLRSLVSKAFTPRAVAELQPRICGIVDDLLADLDGRSRFDLVDGFAFPLPVIVIAEMLGVPPDDRDKFKDWSNDAALIVEPVVSDKQRRRIDDAAAELFEYFDRIIEQRRQSPQDDMITALLNVRDAGDRLTHEELLGTLVLLLVAGNETTRNLIGNGMYALLKHPEQMERLRREPGLLDAAINEMLRYDSPVQMNERMARNDMEIGGRRIRAGQRVLCAIGAANRDPAAFSAPDTLDIARSEKSHISFGRGIHHCLGAPLALLEARIGFSALLARFSQIELAAEPQYRRQMVLRGLDALWVDVEPASASGDAPSALDAVNAANGVNGINKVDGVDGAVGVGIGAH